MTNKASAYACIPKRVFPLTVSLKANNSLLAATSKAPAPGIKARSSMAFLIARKPSRTASLI